MISSHSSKIRVGDGGRIVIPVDARERLGIAVGDEVILTVSDDQVTLTSAKGARQRARERVRRFVGKSPSLAAALIRDRRAESHGE